MPSLTRVDAESRRGLTVERYDLDLDLRGTDDEFRSVSTITFACEPGMTASFVDVAPRRLRGATLNGRALDVEHDLDAATRRLRLDGLAPHNVLVIDAVMTYSHDGEGLHRHVDPADGRVYVYAMSFLDAAPRWFACFDQPDLKAPVALDVRCDPSWFVAGNGPAEQVEPGRWRVAATRPLATYFTTVIAGPYHRIRSEHDGIPLVLHARQSLAEPLEREAAEIFAHTAHCLDALHALFGVRYPWGEYHQAFVPEFNAGAMENPGCVTFRDSMVFRSRPTDSERSARAVTIAHEMAHMWFGDLVTMRWWDDLWLNESFAEYLGHRAVGEHTWAAFGIARKAWGYRADRRPSTHPVAGNGAPDAASALAAFDGISYAKGASVLRQLATHLGDATFLDGLGRYIERHRDGNAQLADLLAAWSAAGATDLEGWAQRWLRTSGVDTLAVDGDDLVIDSPEPRRPHTVTLAALARDGRQVARVQVTADAARTPHGVRADGWVLADAEDETWAKIRLPGTAWAAMPELLPGIAGARSRVVVWNALQLAVEDAELDPRLALDVVLAALPPEGDAVLTAVGGWVGRTLLGACGAGSDGGAARFATAVLDVARTAQPGSGRQLAGTRLAIASSDDVALLQSWRAATDLPEGVTLDADLRWALLHRLSVLGEAGEADIAAGFDADRTSQGAAQAAGCLAARPDASAKARAWRILTEDAARPNYELYAVAEAFWPPSQRELTDPWVDRYFADIAATATLRSGWVVPRLALLAYPWSAVRPDTLAAGDALLADPSLPPGIRRSVVDAADDLRRALRVRERFGR